MAIKTFNPTTPSRRNMTVLSYKGLSKVKPEKSLLEKVKKTAGRNSYGRITVRHIGGGGNTDNRFIILHRFFLSYLEISVCFLGAGSSLQYSGYLTLIPSIK